MARLRVTRTIVIEGREDWVRQVLSLSAVSPGSDRVTSQGTIEELPRQEEYLSLPKRKRKKVAHGS